MLKHVLTTLYPAGRILSGTECPECRDRQAECTRPAGVYWQHRSACSAHGTLTQAPRGVVPEPGTRATGRVLCSAGHGHRVLSIPVQDRPRGRSDRPYRGSGRPYSENERSWCYLNLSIAPTIMTCVLYATRETIIGLDK